MLCSCELKVDRYAFSIGKLRYPFVNNFKQELSLKPVGQL